MRPQDAFVENPAWGASASRSEVQVSSESRSDCSCSLSMPILTKREHYWDEKTAFRYKAVPPPNACSLAETSLLRLA